MMQSNKKLIIIGAGSLGALTLDAALNEGIYSLNQIFFVDDGKNIDEKIHGVPVIGGVSALYELNLKEYDFIIAISNNKIRKKIVETYALNYVNIIHPTAAMSSFANLGVGNIILPNTSIDPNVKIGNHVIINKNNSIGHDSIFNNFSQVSPGCSLGGYTRLEEGVFLGLGVTLLPKVTIGTYSNIGAGAVVTKDIPDHCTAVGVPAKVIK